MYKKIIILLIVLHIEILASQSIKEVLVVSEDWNGYTNQDSSGLYFDIVRMVYEPLGISVKTKIYPYSRSAMMVEKKLADFWLGSYIDEEEYAIYPKYYFDNDILTAMYKKQRFPNFSGLQSLEKKNVGWMRGYGFDEYIDVELIKHERNDRKSILFSLEKDRLDVFLDDKYDMKNALDKLKFNISAYGFTELLRFKLYPAFRNDERGEQLRLIWDRQFKKIMDDGSLKELYIKHDKVKSYLY
ncbi:substrate-binding periplasmic protein [Campylobacterota bacterium]